MRANLVRVIKKTCKQLLYGTITIKNTFANYVHSFLYKQPDPNRDPGGCLVQKGITHDFDKISRLFMV